MADNETFIKSLNNVDKVGLINYMEGLPVELNRFIKRNINAEWFELNMMRGNRKLHPFASIKKWMDMFPPCRTETTENTNSSIYQAVYSSVLNEINNYNFPVDIRNALVNFTNAESYDDETLGKLECEIASFVSSIQDVNMKKNVCKVLASHIILYKARVYDFYTRVSSSVDLPGFTDGDDDFAYYINACILCNINHRHSLSDGHDLAVLVYMYFKSLGINTCIDKYSLLNRFMPLIEDESTDYMSEFINKMKEFNQDNLSVGNCTMRLVNPERYSAVSSFSINNDELPNSIDNTDDVFEDSSYVFLFKGNSALRDRHEHISTELKKLNPENITQYFPGKTSDTISFYLPENDIGHMFNLKGMYIGTAYDKFNSTMKYILLYENEFYLLFRFSMAPSTIYGICLNESNNTRKIISIKKNNNVFYKYISEI